MISQIHIKQMVFQEIQVQNTNIKKYIYLILTKNQSKIYHP